MEMGIASVLLGALLVVLGLIHAVIIWRVVVLLLVAMDEPGSRSKSLMSILGVCLAALSLGLLLALVWPTSWGLALAALVMFAPFSVTVMPLLGILIALLTGARWN